MNKEKNEKGKKYAFNINDINRNKNFKGSALDFKSLNKGTYDEIETNDMTIKDNLEKLRKVKNKSIKEFVYTSKDIPVQWKMKLDYKSNLLKIFLNDTNLLRYLGNGGPSEMEKRQKNKGRIIKLNKEKNKNVVEKKDMEKITNSPNRGMSNKNLNKFGRFKEKHNYLDKEIIGILDDFKSAYPILIKEKERESNDELNKNKKRNRNIKSSIEDKKSQTFYESNFFKRPRHINNLISLPNLKFKNNSNKRQNTFRQNIFTNLLPSSQKSLKDKSPSKFEGNKTYTNFGSIKGDLYLHSNNELFDKKVNINNPVVIKYLEGINFYGPYFSYCPPCGNKNLEFYKNLELKQCLQIIHQIKKNKGKNIVLSEEKTNKKTKEKKREIVKDYSDKNDSDSYNIKAVKNNYSDSMIQQLSNNSSKKNYYNKKFDVVNLA
jgi:hypothetical protein